MYSLLYPCGNIWNIYNRKAATEWGMSSTASLVCQAAEVPIGRNKYTISYASFADSQVTLC